MNKIGILLHLYQPLIQDEKTLREIADSSYLPLIKLIKNNTHIKLTLNTPLSLLEQMEKYGYLDWFEDIKDLLNQDRVEITGSGAYHPLLPKLPESIRQEQIILDEYGLGYYFGRRTGFEGEQAIMVKDLNGFFAPELAVDRDLNLLLSELGYQWMLVDSASFGKANKLKNHKSRTKVFKYEGSSCLVVTRDTYFSNKLAFHKGFNVKSLLAEFAQSEKDTIVALDGETFGHHNEDGIYLLKRLFEALIKSNNYPEDVFVTVSEFVEGKIQESEVEEILGFGQSSWALSKKETNPYYLWEGNKTQDILWEIYNKIIEKILEIEDGEKYKGLENVPIWKDDFLENKEYKEIVRKIRLNQLLASDPFWWISKKTIGENVIYSPYIVGKFLDKYLEVLELFEDENFSKFISKKVKLARESMKKNENSSTSTLLSAP